MTNLKLFTASWCAPCKVVKQELEKFDNAVDIIDIDSNIQMARAANVRSVPTLLTGDGNTYTGVQEILRVIKEAYGKVE